MAPLAIFIGSANATEELFYTELWVSLLPLEEAESNAPCGATLDDGRSRPNSGACWAYTQELDEAAKDPEDVPLAAGLDGPAPPWAI